MSILKDKVSEYLRVSSEITSLEKGLSAKEQELEEKYSADYDNLKRELAGYIANSKPIVQTACNIYKSTAIFSDNRIIVSGRVFKLDYTPLNACEIAMKCGYESYKLLSVIIKEINVNNLCEFAKRYNTVIEIYSSIDELKSRAIANELESYKARINSLKSELGQICKDEKEFDLLVDQMNETSNTIYHKALLQDTKEIQKDFVTEIAIPIGYESCKVDGISADDKVFISSLDWNLHKDGVLNIKVNDEDMDSHALTSCVTNIITQFLFAYPTFNKKILLCDGSSSSAITSFAGILKNENNNLFFDISNDSYIKNSEDAIRTSLAELNRTIHKRIMVLGQSRCRDVLEYNHKNTDNPLELILVLMSGYPFKYGYASDDINSIFKNGKNAGVYTLIVENTYVDEDSRYTRARLPKIDEMDNTLSFSIQNRCGFVCKNNTTYSVNTCGENYNIRKLLSAFKENRSSDNVLTLESILDDDDFTNSARRTNFSKIIDVPFGKEGSNIVNIQLDASDKIAHMAVIGSNGTGKTAFLNTFVLSACKLYSPDELEFHMILMKKADFKVFMDYDLPHLKTLVTGSQVSRANDVLDFIDGEMKRREKLISSMNCNSIYTYNEKADKPLSRCVIVIDEFYQLVENNSQAIQKIIGIAQTGRAYGISLIISAIEFPPEVREIVAQFGNRVEFRANENAGRLISGVENRQHELERGKCFFLQNDNLHFVTVGFSGDDVSDRIKAICRQYPNHKMTVQNIVQTVRIAKENDVPFRMKNAKDDAAAMEKAKKDYCDEQFIRIRLGKTDIYNDYLEYTFNDSNNLLFLFGNYLDTKVMEASLIKDVLVLSSDIQAPTVYYIDNNKNAKYRKKDTIIKRLNSSWTLSGKFIHAVHSDLENTLSDIRDLIADRSSDDDIDIYPVLVVITKADDLFSDDYMRDELLEIINDGKDNSIYFAIQCNEAVSFMDDSKYVKNAIIFPDETSDTMYTAFESMPVADTGDGRRLLAKIQNSALDPKLHILCNKNELSVFIPYEYDEEYLKNIVDLGGLL